MAHRYGTGVIVRIPLLFGLLSGKFNSDSTFGENDHRRTNLSPEKLTVYLKEFDAYKSLFEKYPGYSSTQLSLRFCIAHPACHVVIPGGKNPKQVKENVLASELDFIPFETFANS
jgi:aryl-alcohol dehydrogenase-like predicted oxidoreductase